MEVASLHQPSFNTTNAMDTSMDIDMDIDLGPLPETEPIETEPIIPGTTAIIEEGVVDPLIEEAQYEKVHIRGVDELTTHDIKQFAADHFEVEEPTRIEWIDDTSANIVYSSPETGLQALSAFTQLGAEEDAASLPAMRLRSAKPLSTHPDSVLQVRTAVKTDRKKPRAHEASRFYLMHPEHDPREKLRWELAERRRLGAGDSNNDGDYRRRRFDDRELQRRRGRDGDQMIHADMYDDNRGSTGTDHSDTAGRGRNARRRGGDGDLFPEGEGRLTGRLRNRSASPGRDTLDDEGRDRQDTRRRFRERSPQLTRPNKGKELFPSRGGAGDETSNSRELFPNKTTDSYLKKELFPTNKNSKHHRSDAFDAADETAELIGRRISIPLVDGAQETTTTDRPQRNNKNIELFPDSSNGNGNGNDPGVSIRGLAAQDQGLSIRGAANGISIKGRGASVRELFPSKYNANAGKELFSDKLEGRGGRRRRAEDMFA